MLTELVFEKDEAIAKQKYTVVSREQGAICAWIIARANGEEERVLWIKAAALHDAKGAFIAAIGSVRDITSELGQDLLRQAKLEQAGLPVASTPSQSQGKVLDKLMGRGKASHKQGLRLAYREAKHAEAIPHFDTAIGIDPSHAAAWHDRGVSLRELGQDAEALKSFQKAIELAPDDEEFLYSCADMHKRAGILRAQNSSIEAAIRIFSRLVDINPNNADAWNSLGLCMKELGKDTTATQYFDRANGIIRQNKARRKTRNLDLLV
jgi:Flp pilus assembly protein TadD